MRSVSIRTIGPILVLIPVAVVVLGFGLLATWQGKRVVDDLTGQVVDQAARRVEEQLDRYLATAVHVTELTASMIAAGELDPADLRAWRPDLIRQLSAFEAINSITFGTPEGSATWIIRYPGESGLEYAIKDDQTGEEVVEYRVPQGGESLGERIGSYDYAPRQRPWYQAAEEAGGPTWSDVYPWVRSNSAMATLGLAFVRPVADAEGNRLGVLASDVGLLAVSEFLTGLEVSETGRAFLVGPDGGLLASSSGVAVIGPGGSQVAAAESDDPMVRAVAERVAEESGSFGAIDDREPFELTLDDERYRVEVEPLSGVQGLDWRLAVIVPEADVMGGVQELRRQAAWIGLLVVGLTLGLGIAASLRLVRPIVELVEGVRTIGEGDLDHRVRVEGAREFAMLSTEVNQMAEALKDRLRLRQSLALAMEIQQKLLPEETPALPGLDIAGHSTYCDETGGDYYDFLELDETTQGDLIVVLGDVMGHGIAAALLMATARGVLRTRASESGSLGQLLTHVNRQLEADTGGERFMTMILMVVDAPHHAIRWASAGHDAPIVYDPQSDAFLDLPNINGLPLGLLDDSEYEEAVWDGLGSGHIVLLGTDGIWETRSPSEEEFGKDRLRDIIRAHRDEPSERISVAINDALKQFRGDSHQDDDITFVVVKLA
ncbi:SpoIIE family protein phosphatase [Tautonia marina]|uniref:SpoIIE family protein phosphatase n=1 Tax=Tautonia marina TaxID=2653855 RepID=UPI0012610E9D|nr:SpoIIE family protein phosphatase [Tautonia marina]